MKIGKYCAKHRKYCRHRRKRRFTVASGQVQRGMSETSRVPRDLGPLAELAAAVAEVAVETAIANTGYFQRRYTPPKPRGVRPGRRVQPRLIPANPSKYTNGRRPYRPGVRRVTTPTTGSSGHRGWRYHPRGMGGRSALPTGYLKIFN